MSKYDYLHALYQQLISIDPDKRKEIMRDLENKFRHAEDNGLGELSVTNQLGTPSEYAKKLLEEDLPREDKREDSINQNSTSSPDINFDEASTANSEIIEKFQDDVSKIQEELKGSVNTLGLTLEHGPLIDDDIFKGKPAVKEIIEPEKIEAEPIPETPKEVKEPLKPTIYNEPAAETKPRVYTSSQPVQTRIKSNHPVQMLIVTFGLFLFNTVFVLGPFVAIWALIISFVAVGFALTISGVGVLISAIFAIPFSFVSIPVLIINHPILLFCFGFVILGIGGLLSIAMIYSVRLFGLLTARYASWNLRLIRGF